MVTEPEVVLDVLEGTAPEMVTEEIMAQEEKFK